MVNKCTDCTKHKKISHVKEKFIIKHTPKASFEIMAIESIDTVGP